VKIHRVHLVGIGPGSPDLLTLKAAESIRAADVIRHPPGVAAAILGHARPGAQIGPYESDDEILHLASHEHRVAVLFFGDPFVFSPGAELAGRLSNAGLEFDVVPGILHESAGSAISGITLSVIGLTPADGSTGAFRIPAGEMQASVSNLLAQGHSPDVAAAVIFNPGGPGQRKVMAPLRHLAGLAAAGVEGDVLLVVGPGVESGDRLDTLARRPLHGFRVLVTRARQQAEEFHRQLSDLGAWVVDVPTIEVRPTRLDAHMREAIERLPDTSLVVFASSNAVEIFFDMLFELGQDARRLRDCRLCAIGPETARSLESHGLRPDRVSGEYTAEGLVETLRGWDLRGARILVPRSRQNRDALPALLAQHGAEVELLFVYELACPAAAAPALRRLFEAEPVDVVTFTSSSTAVNFASAFGEGLKGALEETKVACMGPVTADTARQLGMRVDIIAGEYTSRGLASAIAAFFTA